jgi:hypothetical protein
MNGNSESVSQNGTLDAGDICREESAAIAPQVFSGRPRGHATDATGIVIETFAESEAELLEQVQALEALVATLRALLSEALATIQRLSRREARAKVVHQALVEEYRRARAKGAA